MALILQQPDLGTALLFPLVLLAMLFGSGIRARYLALVLAGSALAMPFLWKAMSAVQRGRITSFLEQRDTGDRPREAGYQLYQSKLMIALGGPTGSPDAGLVHLPFDHTDFIFSVIAGKWGLAGASLTLALFGLFLARGYVISWNASEPFARLLALGLVTLLASQAVINLAMTVGMAPITGLTLPFVSYGGSSLVTCYLALGVLLGIRCHYSNPWRLGFGC
jgi:cell division protein FtsW (lipid II flippase)